MDRIFERHERLARILDERVNRAEKRLEAGQKTLRDPMPGFWNALVSFTSAALLPFVMLGALMAALLFLTDRGRD